MVFGFGKKKYSSQSSRMKAIKKGNTRLVEPKVKIYVDGKLSDTTSSSNAADFAVRSRRFGNKVKIGKGVVRVTTSSRKQSTQKSPKSKSSRRKRPSRRSPYNYASF